MARDTSNQAPSMYVCDPTYNLSEVGNTGVRRICAYGPKKKFFEKILILIGSGVVDMDAVNNLRHENHSYHELKEEERSNIESAFHDYNEIRSQGSEQIEIQATHGACPSCAKKAMEEISESIRQRNKPLDSEMT